MANFKPLKRYILDLIDILIEKRSLRDPFLDVGCGQGDVALHLAKRGWHGLAIDPSESAAATARDILRPYQEQVRVKSATIKEINETFQTVLLLDVLEHVTDGHNLLTEIRNKLSPDGKLIMTVPVKKHEWRWDDNFYGHITRYEMDELVNFLSENGFRVVENWDCTFPFFWALRRAYTRLLSPQSTHEYTPQERTLKSSHNSAWNQYGWLSAIMENRVIWKLLLLFQRLFRHSRFGFERLIIAEMK